MDKVIFEKYKTDRYEGQMHYYSDKSRKNQKRYRQSQWILIILSALTPVAAAFNVVKWGTGDDAHTINLNIIVVIISSIVAILTTGLKTFNYQELWITYRGTYERLKPEIYYYDFNIGDYGKPGIDKESMFVSRVEAILDTEHTSWPPAKKMNDEQNKPPADEIEMPVKPVQGGTETESKPPGIEEETTDTPSPISDENTSVDNNVITRPPGDIEPKEE